MMDGMHTGWLFLDMTLKQAWRASLLPVAGWPVGLALLVALCYCCGLGESAWSAQKWAHTKGPVVLKKMPLASQRQSLAPGGVTRGDLVRMVAQARALRAGRVEVSTFSDVPVSDPLAEPVQAVANEGWIAGTPDGRFLPEKPLSLADLVTVVGQATGKTPPDPQQTRTLLADVPAAVKLPAWARPWMALTLQLGLVPEAVLADLQATNSENHAKAIDKALVANWLDRLPPPMQDAVAREVVEQSVVARVIVPAQKPSLTLDTGRVLTEGAPPEPGESEQMPHPVSLVPESRSILPPQNRIIPPEEGLGQQPPPVEAERRQSPPEQPVLAWRQARYVRDDNMLEMPYPDTAPEHAAEVEGRDW
jgi:hypothetical protein